MKRMWTVTILVALVVIALTTVIANEVYPRTVELPDVPYDQPFDLELLDIDLTTRQPLLIVTVENRTNARIQLEWDKIGTVLETIELYDAAGHAWTWDTPPSYSLDWMMNWYPYHELDPGERTRLRFTATAMTLRRDSLLGGLAPKPPQLIYVLTGTAPVSANALPRDSNKQLIAVGETRVSW